jgi:hypothetical protein
MGFDSLINSYNWNRFIFKINYNSSTNSCRLQLVINNNFKVPAVDVTNFISDCSLKYVVFCHLESVCLAGSNIKWYAGMYKDLRLWNLSITNDLVREQLLNL